MKGVPNDKTNGNAFPGSKKSMNSPLKYKIWPIAKANRPNKIHIFLFFSLTYLNPRNTSPKNPKNKPITVNNLKKKYPSKFKQKQTIPNATKNNDATPLRTIVLKE